MFFSSYPGDPLLWIRDAAAYLNLTLALPTNELTPADFQVSMLWNFFVVSDARPK